MKLQQTFLQRQRSCWLSWESRAPTLHCPAGTSLMTKALHSWCPAMSTAVSSLQQLPPRVRQGCPAQCCPRWGAQASTQRGPWTSNFTRETAGRSGSMRGWSRTRPTAPWWAAMTSLSPSPALSSPTSFSWLKTCGAASPRWRSAASGARPATRPPSRWRRSRCGCRGGLPRSASPRSRTGGGTGRGLRPAWTARTSLLPSPCASSSRPRGRERWRVTGSPSLSWTFSLSWTAMQGSFCGPSRARPRGWSPPHRRVDLLLRADRKAEVRGVHLRYREGRHFGFNRRGTLTEIPNYIGTFDLLLCAYINGVFTESGHM